MQELVKAGASATLVDTNKRNALHHACRKDHDDVARYLLEAVKMDINAASESKDTPLHKASGWFAIAAVELSRQLTRTVMWLVAPSPLNPSVRGKCVKTVVVLLKYGADPNLRNDVRPVWGWITLL